MASSEAVSSLPEDLRQAQKSIEIPEVQDMLQRLSKYNLGIFMPHIHDEDTGGFATLPEGVTQVEDALQVSFHDANELADEGNRTYLPVGWYWRQGITASMECVVRCVMVGTVHSVGSHLPGPGEDELNPRDE